MIISFHLVMSTTLDKKVSFKEYSLDHGPKIIERTKKRKQKEKGKCYSTKTGREMRGKFLLSAPLSFFIFCLFLIYFTVYPSINQK